MAKLQEALKNESSSGSQGHLKGALYKNQGAVNPITRPNLPVNHVEGLGANRLLNQNVGTRKPLNLTPKQMEEKRLKNQCFWCDERFTPGHKCKNRQLYMITVQDDEDDGVEMGYGTEVSDVGQKMLEEANPQLSLHALEGTYNYQTMRLRGSVGRKGLCILIDSGSTHNFIDERMASKLGCVMESIDELRVSAANGNKLSCKETCKRFLWTMQGQNFEASVLALPLDNYDLVLGVQWLVGLGDIVWNFKNL